MYQRSHLASLALGETTCFEEFKERTRRESDVVGKTTEAADKRVRNIHRLQNQPTAWLQGDIACIEECEHFLLLESLVDHIQ